MRINYNVSGEKRKSLVGAVSQELNAPAKYLGAPTFAYEVGGYSVDKSGMLMGADNHYLVADVQGLHDFKAVSEEYDTPLPETEPVNRLQSLCVHKAQVHDESVRDTLLDLANYAIMSVIELEHSNITETEETK